MKLVPLSQVSQFLTAGVTLPWGVRDSNGTLLLARGHVLIDARELQALLARGVFVDAAEAASMAKRADSVKDEFNLNSVWMGMESHLGKLLRTPAEPLFLDRVNEVITKVGLMAGGNVDQLIFLIMRHDHARLANYGVTIRCMLRRCRPCFPKSLMARRPSPQRHRRGAALTMNLAMLDLQGELAIAVAPPNAKERTVIQSHTQHSAAYLRAAGLDDQTWLEAVEQHHEEVGGTGYPSKTMQPTEEARLIRVVDTFTAKHSPRRGRQPQPAQKAARDLYVQSMGDPFAGLLIKEFGIYPPGCYVKLASGELAIVTHRGTTANAPIVAAVTNKNGDQLSLPVRRDTAQATHAVVSTVPESSVMVRVSVEAIYGGPKR